MKHLLRALYTTFAVLFLVSCNKDDVNDLPDTATKQLKEMVFIDGTSGDSTVYSFKYDADDNLKEIYYDGGIMVEFTGESASELSCRLTMKDDEVGVDDVLDISVIKDADKRIINIEQYINTIYSGSSLGEISLFGIFHLGLGGIAGGGTASDFAYLNNDLKFRFEYLEMGIWPIPYEKHISGDMNVTYSAAKNMSVLPFQDAASVAGWSISVAMAPSLLLYALNLKGYHVYKPSDGLVTKKTFTSDERDVAFYYDYEHDADGYVTKMSIKQGVSMPYSEIFVFRYLE